MNSPDLRCLFGMFPVPHSAFIAIALFLFYSSALADPVARYGGGGYDGYDRSSAPSAIGYPQANNAGGATNITASSAWLNGMLVATGSAETVVYVYWGTTNGGTNKASWEAWTNFGVCIEEQALTTNVSVNPNTPYYYRFYATNAVGDEGWASVSASFLSAGPPILNTGVSAAPLSFATATLNGNLTAGVSATVSVFWGQNTNAWIGTNSLGTRSQGAFQTPVSGLSPGTLYYYRCYGTNVYGEGWSDILAFTTRVVSVARVYGGNYDGYDRRDTQTSLQGIVGGPQFMFY